MYVTLLYDVLSTLKFDQLSCINCSERRRQNVRGKRVDSGVSRAISMPSVYDVTQMPKVSSSAYGLSKSKESKRDKGETCTVREKACKLYCFIFGITLSSHIQICKF